MSEEKNNYWGFSNGIGGYYYSDSKEKLIEWLKGYREEYGGTWKALRSYPPIYNVTDFIYETEKHKYSYELNHFISGLYE